MCPTFHTRERNVYCLLIPITSRGRPVFRGVSCRDFLCQDWVICTHASVKNQRTSEFSFAESKCADTGTNDPDILQRSVRSVERVCLATSHMALFHVIPRVSLEATVLAKGRTLPEGSADLEFLHLANGKGMLTSERWVIFQ